MYLVAFLFELVVFTRSFPETMLIQVHEFCEIAFKQMDQLNLLSWKM